MKDKGVSLVVRVRLPVGAARLFGSLAPEHRSRVVLAGMQALGLLPEEGRGKTLAPAQGQGR